MNFLIHGFDDQKQIIEKNESHAVTRIYILYNVCVYYVYYVYYTTYIIYNILLLYYIAMLCCYVTLLYCYNYLLKKIRNYVVFSAISFVLLALFFPLSFLLSFL